MSAAGKVAEPAENMTLWFDEKLSIKEERKNDTNDNGNNNNNKSNANKYNTTATAALPRMFPTNTNNNQSKEFNEICKKAQAGQKIMIIMRGAPGSGKSTLANAMLQQIRLLEQYTVRDFVYSTDDYFFTQRGYEFNPTLLPDAHEWNQQRVRRKAAAGWSPIIVDNTSMMIWEMIPYAQSAVQHGYILELLEPQTSWSKSAGKLAQKNVHQVPKENIQRMLDRYERVTVPVLLRLLKETKYTVPLPQLRSEPPLPALPAAPPTTSLQTEAGNPNANSNPKVDEFKLNVNADSWVPYEIKAPNYWAEVSESKIKTPVAGAVAKGENSLINLLRDETTETTVSCAPQVASTDGPLQRHSLDCPNESAGFVLLRQMYPNKLVIGLWDLYVKCNGDVDWAVDILLKEDELNADGAAYAEDALLLEYEQFKCACNSNDFQLETPAPAALCLPMVNKSVAKPQRQPRSKRNGGLSSASSSSNKELQLQIENCFVLSDNNYSDHTRKIRDIRNGILDQPLPPVEPAAPSGAPDEDDDDSEDNALLEMELGDTLIAQLRSNFQWEGEMLPMEPELSPTKVFVPRQVAKQLYMVWLEAVHNQLEEQRQQTMRDDEQFARLLKHPQYAECIESPSNVNELLDMELAWSIYNSEQQAENQATRQKPNDIATHLTKMKLCEKFPNIPNDTVLEVFAATDNNYVKTLDLLGTNVKCELTSAQLYEQALRENEKLNAQEQQEQQQQPPPKLSSPRNTVNAKAQSPQLHEEAKNAALRDFEETRNMAAHHAQLRAECILKAKLAIQQSNGSTALYYSEIAQLHKRKIDVFNHRAANCIMEVHKHTQNNPDLLDLHYLHAMEAVSCLDLFLDRHITVLRNCTRVYKHVFIITGRGLHSANGVSTIKKRVKARLADRRLRWQEVNPGLLRVKVFSASRHAKNF